MSPSLVIDMRSQSTMFYRLLHKFQFFEKKGYSLAESKVWYSIAYATLPLPYH